MNEIEALKWQLGQYSAVFTLQINRLYSALEELQRTTLFLLQHSTGPEQAIDRWLEKEQFIVDEDGFFQSLPLVTAHRAGTAPPDAVSMSWSGQLRSDPMARRHMYCHRNIGAHLKHIHDNLGDVGWIYYQDASNTSLQYPYIEQRAAITSDFDWSTYHTYLAAGPQNNPQRQIRWTPPTIDYAGEGLILSVSIPVWQEDTYIGLWSIDLPTRYLHRDFTSTKSLADQVQFIVNDKGMLVLHEELQKETNASKGQALLQPLATLGGQWAQLDLKTILTEKKDPLDITDGNGTEWIFCYSHVPGVEWYLFCGLPKASMEEAAAQRLSQAFQQIGEGNFSYQIEDSSSKALATLIEEFNEMSKRLTQAEQSRRDMETALFQAQKMEAIGKLAGGVAHDNNNIITLIMGYAEMALGKSGEQDSLRSDIQEIRKAAKKSADLTRQLLAFARRQSIAPKILDINLIVQNMLKMLQRLIGEDVELIWRPAEQVWPIKIDPVQVDQILANLCVNARDAIRGNGKVIIETKNTELDDDYCTLHRGFLPGSFVQLAVSDNGIGMDSSILERIFEPFFSTKEVGRGTGLGLATIYGIVKQNNGFINVYSEPNLGTTVKTYLPRVTENPVALIPEAAPEIAKGHNETLLLVEDEADVIRLIERMLQELGYQVLATTSTKEAIILAEQHKDSISMLLTDVIMPELNGRELEKRITEIVPGISVLFMSGYTSNVIIHQGVLDGDVILLQKPFSKQELATKIQEVFSRSRSPSQG